MTFLQFLTIVAAAGLLVSPMIAIPRMLAEPGPLPSLAEIGSGIRVAFYTVLVILVTVGVIGFFMGHPIFLLLLLLCGGCGATAARR